MYLYNYKKVNSILFGVKNQCFKSVLKYLHLIFKYYLIIIKHIKCLNLKPEYNTLKSH